MMMEFIFIFLIRKSNRLHIDIIEIIVSIVSHCTKITFFQVVSVEIISIVIFNSVYSIMVLSVNVAGKGVFLKSNRIDQKSIRSF